MKIIKGRFAEAKVYTDTIEEQAEIQLRTLCDQPFAEGHLIRIMPDVHAGAGCVIGFTADLGDMVVPNLVGVDIGCGMLTIELGRRDVDFARLDSVIKERVPSGMTARENAISGYPALKEMHCYEALIPHLDWIERSLGTLGGGNHFIEVDEDDSGNRYLVIHTGSRNLGVQTAKFYQNMAIDTLSGKADIPQKVNELIAQLKAEGREREIQKAVASLRRELESAQPSVPRDLCYLTGEGREMYLHDMAICQAYARDNRRMIADVILDGLFGLKLDDFEHFETVHNYIDLESNILRKGSVSAKEGERLLIPINMRDGSLICRGKGNPDWNFSAPHGAGRLFSRAEAKRRFSVESFRSEMEGIYTTTANADTLDECPMAYKDMAEIIANVVPTVDIEAVIRPLYNFKAAE